MATNKIKATDIISRCELSVDITHLKSLRFKIAIGLFFIKLACWIIGCGIDIKNEIEPEEK